MTFTLGYAQLVYISITLVSLMCVIRKHGQPRTGEYDAWVHVVAVAIGYSILWWGGFFSQR